MTKTNQAFIKAYRHDAAGPTAKAPILRASAAARTAVHSAPLIGAAPAGERSAIYNPLPANPPPKPVTSTASRSDAPSGPKQPLSSFIPNSTNSAAEPLTEGNELLRPGTIVASFHWPPVCRAILQRAAPQLDAALDVMLQKAKAGHSLFAVLGLFPGSGTTATAMCLAARLAARGSRTVLVDANFIRPRIATWLEVVPTATWQDVLKNAAPLSDAVIRARTTHLDMLTLGAQKSNNPARLVGGLQAVVTAGVLRHAYDIAIFDAGAFFDAASQPVLLEMVRNMGIDAAVAVAGTKPADSRDVEAIAGHLSRSSCELIGTIENRVTIRDAA